MKTAVCIGAAAWALTSGYVARADDLNVILIFDDHRIMTPAFRQGVRADVASELNASIGPLARVRVWDYGMERPAGRLLAWEHAARDGPESLPHIDRPDCAKSHFVWLGYDDAEYVIRSRQLDGSLGWCSPITRHETTADRAAVAHVIISQINRDYGPVFHIVASDSDRSASLRLNTGDVADIALRPWVKPGDVLAVVQTTGNGRSQQVPNTVLIATKEPNSGQIETRVESRYLKVLSGWQSGRLRAIKLGCGRGPVRLRLIAPGGTPAMDYTVRLSANGIDFIRELSVARRGRFVSADAYDRVGYVQVMNGDRVIVQAPVPILGDEPTSIEIGSAQGDSSGDSDLRLCRLRLHDLAGRLSEDCDRLRGELQARKNTTARTTTEAILRYLDPELDRLAGEVASLHGRPGLGQRELDEYARMIRDLKTQQASLQHTRDNLDRAIKAAASPEATDRRSKLAALKAQAERAEQDADFESAIVTYEDILKQENDWPEVQKRLEDLKREWAIKSPAHAAARKFVYETWAKATSVDDFDRQMKQAADAFSTLKNVGDTLTSRKLYRGLRRASGMILNRYEELRRSDTEESNKQSESLSKLALAVRNLLGEVEEFAKPQK